MLSDADLSWLVQQLVGTSELLGQALSPSAAAMLADDLSAYPRPALARALSRVRTEHSGRLTPKAVLDRLDEAMGRPAANEAWAIALQALDERATVVWTDETAMAWSIARPIAAGGDLVGARMAFIAGYERMVRAARADKRSPATRVSSGWDSSQRESAMEHAEKMGYITAEQRTEHSLLLPAPDGYAATAGAPEDVCAQLAALRNDLAMSQFRKTRNAAARSRIEREQLRDRKAKVDAAVALYRSASCAEEGGERG